MPLGREVGVTIFGDFSSIGRYFTFLLNAYYVGVFDGIIVYYTVEFGGLSELQFCTHTPVCLLFNLNV